MKVTGLILATLSIVALAQATKDYRLKCTQEEMGVRWPSYISHSDYYVCPYVGGRQMTISCKPGEIFTFVLQMCTSASKYIPAPEMDILPISSASKPVHNHVAHPPIFNGAKPQVFETNPMKPQYPPTEELPKPPVVWVDEPKHDEHHIKGEHHIKEEHHVNGHHANGHHANEEEVVESGKHTKPIAVMPPMPPTPAPTPPMVDPVVASAETVKKPVATIGKKPVADKKKTGAKPTKADSNKPTSEKAAKKTPKSPTKAGAKPTKADSNKPTSEKAAKKTPTSPKKTPAPAPAKKSPKAPSKTAPKAPSKA